MSLSSTGNSEPTFAQFLKLGADGQKWDTQDDDTFDPTRFYMWQSDCRRLLVSREELTWLDKHTVPDRSVDIFLNLSCGTQRVPHTTFELVDIFTALGVNFVAGIGPQFCCGKPFLTHARKETGRQVTQSSLDRFAEWGATTAVHACPSCQIVFSAHAAQENNAIPGWTNVHVATFLADRLRQLGDRVPWRREVPMRVLVHGHDVTTVHATAFDRATEVLTMIPGVEVLGRVDPPSRGNPCATIAPGAPNVLAGLDAGERRAVTAELAEQARTLGAASAIVTCNNNCTREWAKFASDTLAIKSFISVLAEALGCARTDRYQELWRLNDPEAVVHRTRPYWESWGLTEDRARLIAYKNFHPHYSGFFNPKCACGGDPARCTTGKVTVPGPS